MLAEGEFRREARRVLPRLTAPGAHIRAVERGFGVFVARNGFRRPVLVLSSLIMRSLLSHEMLCQAPPERGSEGREPVYRLSTVGEAFLRRLAAPGEHSHSAQHRLLTETTVVIEGQSQRPARLNEGESPIGWLRRRKGPDGKPLLGEAAYDAAERLREDFTLARLMPRVTADWSLAPGTAPKNRGADAAVTVNDAALAARQRVGRALDAVGPGLADALVQVCCHLKGLEQAERDLDWPRRSGKLVLSIALERLAVHYGFVRVCSKEQDPAP